jgi:hypothetical protein
MISQSTNPEIRVSNMKYISSLEISIPASVVGCLLAAPVCHGDGFITH